MNKVDFAQMLTELNSFYGLEKNISPDRFSQWFQKVNDVPHPAIDFIKSRIEDNFDSMPRNIPKCIRVFYHEWRNANSSQTMNYVKTECSECNGSGFLFVKRNAKLNGYDIFERVAYRCASCENWKEYVHENAIPSATIEQIQSFGYQII